MGRLEDLKHLRDSARDMVRDPEFKEKVTRAAGDAVVAASGVVEGAEEVARRSGMTNRRGEVSKFKLAKSALNPAATARTVLGATAEVIKEGRAEPGRERDPGAQAAP